MAGVCACTIGCYTWSRCRAYAPTIRSREPQVNHVAQAEIPENENRTERRHKRRE